MSKHQTVASKGNCIHSEISARCVKKPMLHCTVGVIMLTRSYQLLLELPSDFPSNTLPSRVENEHDAPMSFSK